VYDPRSRLRNVTGDSSKSEAPRKHSEFPLLIAIIILTRSSYPRGFNPPERCGALPSYRFPSLPLVLSSARFPATRTNGARARARGKIPRCEFRVFHVNERQRDARRAERELRRSVWLEIKTRAPTRDPPRDSSQSSNEINDRSIDRTRLPSDWTRGVVISAYVVAFVAFRLCANPLAA